MSESPWHLGTYPIVLSKSYLMNTNMAIDRVLMVFRNVCVPVLWTKVASALEGLRTAILILLNDMKLTKLLLRHLHRKAVCYLLVKFLKLTLLNLINLKHRGGRQKS